VQGRSVTKPARDWPWLICLVVALTACGGGGGGSRAAAVAAVPPPAAFPAPHSQCSLAEAKSDVLDIFENYYFFNDIPAQAAKYPTIRANLGSYASVDALLDALRYQSGTFDRGFSYYATKEEVEQFFSAGEFFGFGFSWTIDQNGAWRVIDVYGGSPADLGGLVRGDTITAVDGTAAAALNPYAESTFGPSAEGIERTLTIRSVDGSTRTVTLRKTTVDLDPVPQDRVQVFDVAGRKVGYVFFRSFIEDADDLLRSTFASLKAQAVDDVIVDLRYNGGGLVDTAEVLGSLMAGNARAGLIFFSYEYNDWVTNNYGGPDDIRQFHAEADALDGLESVYYLTGAGTASASELTISGLKPYMTRSINVGERTYGKPVGQWGLNYCNDSMVLFVVTFRTVNSLGVADYYGGMPADCAAPDDWDHLLGDPDEARLKAALDYIETSGAVCTPPVMAAAAASLNGAPVLELPSDHDGISLARRFLGAD
jgi:carboxyl-terminal processing protease